MIASLILLLHLGGILPLQSAVTSLYIVAAVLVIAEVGIVSFGLLTFNALLAAYAGYSLQEGVDPIFQVSPDWPMLFGVATIEVIVLVIVIIIYRWIRGQKITTGNEAMIGQNATVLKWDKSKGQIRYEGEIWSAYSEQPLSVKQSDTVKILATERMRVKVSL